MKRAFAFFLTLMIAAQAGFCREYSREQLETKKQKFSRMKTTGFTLAAIGAAMLVGGAVLAANGEWETEPTPTGGTQTNAQDASAGFSVLFLGLGVPSTVGGLILGGIGARKANQYHEMLEDMEVGFQLGEDRKALLLTYSF